MKIETNFNNSTLVDLITHDAPAAEWTYCVFSPKIFGKMIKISLP